MSTLEIAAALTGALGVWLSVRQNILSWPVGIVNVALYAIVFRDARLYADMGLQIVYAILSIYGWHQWLYGGQRGSALRVSRTTIRQSVLLAPVALTASAVLGTILRTTTDAAVPYLDSFLSATSLVAQFMMTRKKLESWLVWIFVDVLYVGLFVWRDLHVTAVLYAVFLVLAVRGFVDWRRSMGAVADGGEPLRAG